jgi:thioredoxin 1
MKIITDQNFEEFVMKNEKPAVIDFFTTWCPPCKMLAPIIEKLAEDYKEKVDFFKMDLDQSPMTGSKFQVDRIPTVIFFNKGEIVSSFIGFREEKEIKDWISSALNSK